MWDIVESIQGYNKNVSLRLKANKPLNPYHISYPIEWTGFVNSMPIKILQLGPSSSFSSDYDFIDFPPEIAATKGEIIEQINSKLKRLLD